MKDNNLCEHCGMSGRIDSKDCYFCTNNITLNKCKKCGLFKNLFENECIECYANRLNKPSLRSRIFGFVLVRISSCFTFASIFGMHLILMEHLHYTSNEMIFQGFALGWVTSKFIRNY